MSPTRSAVVFVSRPLLLLGVLCLLCVACEKRPPPQVGDPTGPGSPGTPDTGETGGDGGGGLVVASDGGTFAPKPTCPGGAAACAGACVDGGSICLGNCGFLPPVRYALSGDQVDLAVGDLQGDGAEDLVTADSQGNGINVLLNQQGGLFLKPSVWGANRPTSLALTRLDADSTLDVLFTNGGTSSLGLYRGQGDGTFGSFAFSPVGGTPRGVTVWEDNGQRRVAVLRTDIDELSVFPVNSDGTVGTVASYAAPREPWAQVAADFNGDGRNDLAVTHVETCGSAGDTSCQSVGVFLARPDGTFEAQRLTSTGGTPVALVAARLDPDALLDVIVADASRHQVLVLSGRGDGSFFVRAAYPTVRTPSRLVLTDINRDTVLDLVVGSQGSDLSVLLGQAGGTFAAQVPLTATTLDQGVRALGASDFDRDGIQDLAVLSPTGVQLLWGICR